ncbi:unnamed protein product [Cuscuta campestris]|uniref:BZIP domain-containing protein n=1 Tax=Cuscuta campestris TaxID=132261 RepID=A0A484M4C0_9ASTE|nr:unnamed protein product [Cuscuta campestris]
MDKDRAPSLGGGSLPPCGRYSPFASSNDGFSGNPEPSRSFNLPPLVGASGTSHFGIGATSDSNCFSQDISQMPENPPKNLGHRRAHSEILALPDDICFDSDLGIVGGFDGPSLSDENEEDLLSSYFDMDKFNSSSATSSFLGHGSSSSPAASPAGVSGSSQAPSSATPLAGNVTSAVSEKPRIRHQHSQSMDGSTTINPEMLRSGADEPSTAESKKAISAANLAELALIDPKRAKRIWANRQSAARSKERKMRYIAELERKVQALQTEATSLSAQFTLLQRDTNGLNAENNELKLRLQTMEQQVHLQDALNDALKEEIQHLKVLTGQGMANSGPMMMNFAPPLGGGNHQFYPNNNHAMHALLTAQQFQQLQLHSQKPQPQQYHQPPPPRVNPPDKQPHQSTDSKMRSSLSASALNEHPST